VRVCADDASRLPKPPSQTPYPRTHRFGGSVEAHHVALCAALLPPLEEGRATVRKRSQQCVAALAPHLNDERLAGVLSHLLARLGPKGCAKRDATRTLVLTLGAVSRAVGFRFGPHLAAAVPLAIAHCDRAGEGDDEMREACLQALEGFATHCAADARPHLDAILGAALKCVFRFGFFTPCSSAPRASRGARARGGRPPALFPLTCTPR